jgi:hypothetical protein
MISTDGSRTESIEEVDRSPMAIVSTTRSTHIGTRRLKPTTTNKKNNKKTTKYIRVTTKHPKTTVSTEGGNMMDSGCYT